MHADSLLPKVYITLDSSDVQVYTLLLGVRKTGNNEIWPFQRHMAGN